MRATRTAIPEVLLIEPATFSDDRGFFYESFNQNDFSQATGLSVSFVQDNHSMSVKNVLRGLHFQTGPKAQGKLVRTVRGAVFDVAVDLRMGSPTRGTWVGQVLSEENKLQLWIPPGFAHGFLTLTETAEFLYKTTEYYSPLHEGSIRWDDPILAIDWPLQSAPIVSAKDATASTFDSSKDRIV